MFHQARLRLTAWYLIIVMAISLAFSGFIYRVLMLQIERYSQAQQFRIDRRFMELGLPSPQIDFAGSAKVSLINTLLAVNGGILLISTGAGYLLAGRTLKPIQDMVKQQNQFISDASHELRTPLTSLKTAMEVSLRDPQLTIREARDLISENLHDVDKLQSLSDGLLQLARFQRPDNFHSFQPVPLKTISASAKAGVKSLAKAKNISITGSFSPHRVIGDPAALTDLLVILLDNAIKYSSPGTVVNLSSATTDGHVLLSVTDHGIGIDSTDLPFIFDRFYRSDTSRARHDTGGYGLGLAIAQKIVTLHHGTISVTSTPGQGSVFTVKLPLDFSHTSAKAPKLSSSKKL